MKTLTIMLLVLVCLFSCKKDKDIASPEVLAVKAQLLGKWKLDSVKYEYYNMANVKMDERVNVGQAITLQLSDEGSGALVRPGLYGQFITAMRNDLILKVSVETDGNYLTALDANSVEPKLKIDILTQAKLKTISAAFDIDLMVGNISQKSHGLITTSWYTRAQ